MQDPLIALGAFAATVLLIVLNWLIGGWSSARIDDVQTVRERYGEDHWQDRVTEVALDTEGRAALLALAGADADAVGLVVALGDKTVTRRLTADVVRTAETEGPQLVLRLRDFVLPKVALILEEKGQAETWAERLKALRPAPAAANGRSWNSRAR